MTDRVSFLAFFFSESLNYVKLKLTFSMTFFFFAGDKDMISKELKFYLLIKQNTLKLYASMLILPFMERVRKGEKER